MIEEQSVGSGAVTEQQRSRWIFTLNNYDTTFDYNKHLSEECHRIKRFVFGYEIGEATSTPHLQGYLELTRSYRLGYVSRILPRAFWNPARGTALENFVYCTKSGNFATLGDWTKEQSGSNKNSVIPVSMMLRGLLDQDLNLQMKTTKEYAEKHSYYNMMVTTMQELHYQHELFAEYKEKKLFPWQFKCLQDAMKQNDRHILWITDRQGNLGKTFLSEYLSIIYGFQVLGGVTSEKDLVFQIDKSCCGFCFDVCRDDASNSNYGALEAIKNGRLTTGKYFGKTIRFRRRPVIVFANDYPLQQKLSADRWIIVTLGEGEYSNVDSVASVSPLIHFPAKPPKPLPNLDDDFNVKEHALLHMSRKGILSSDTNNRRGRGELTRVVGHVLPLVHQQADEIPSAQETPDVVLDADENEQFDEVNSTPEEIVHHIGDSNDGDENREIEHLIHQTGESISEGSHLPNPHSEGLEDIQVSVQFHHREISQVQVGQNTHQNNFSASPDILASASAGSAQETTADVRRFTSQGISEFDILYFQIKINVCINFFKNRYWIDL